MEVVSETGASTWISMLPIQEHGIALHNRAFIVALCLCYCWQPNLLPSTCVCGKTFSIELTLNCPCGGYPSIRHNELQDITATLLTEVSHVYHPSMTDTVTTPQHLVCKVLQSAYQPYVDEYH